MRSIIFAALAAFLSAVSISGHTATLDPNRSIVVEYVKVYDGDTVDVRLPILPRPLDKLRIRIGGIDTAEIGKGAKCPEEQVKALAAKLYLESLLAGATEIRVYGFKWDKYGGRLLGDLHVLGGSVREIMIAEGYAVPYSGSGARQSWCPLQ
jgi:endonuclease YncB( thermonuclease family)